MTYDGQVQVGGPAQKHVEGDLEITKFAVGELANNVYLLRCQATGEGLIIDAADDDERILRELGGAPVARIVTTHWHPDHWQALAAVADATGAETIASAIDAPHIDVPAARTVKHHDRIAVGSVELDVIEISGHTDGSIVLAYTAPDGISHLFTGDSLFPGGVGKTFSPEDFTRLIDQVEERIFDEFDDATRFYPGHGNDSHLGAERSQLPQWRERGW